MREEGERDVFTWVRGRTPSLQDPYVWFDPINPTPVRAERVAEDDAERSDEPRNTLVEQATEGEGRNGRSRRRRGRGRGRGEATHDAKVEDRAVNEGLPPVGSPDTPIAVVIEDETATEAAPEAAPVLEPVEAPKRRRVRRKVASAIAEELNEVAAEQQAETPAAEADAVAPEVEVEAEQPAPVPAELDVTPAVAARIEQAIEEVLAEEAVVLAEPVPAPTPEVDIAAIMRAKRAGAQGYLLKPFNRPQLLDRFRVFQTAA